MRVTWGRAGWVACAVYFVTIMVAARTASIVQRQFEPPTDAQMLVFVFAVFFAFCAGVTAGAHSR